MVEWDLFYQNPFFLLIYVVDAAVYSCGHSAYSYKTFSLYKFRWKKNADFQSCPDGPEYYIVSETT